MGRKRDDGGGDGTGSAINPACIAPFSPPSLPVFLLLTEVRRVAAKAMFFVIADLRLMRARVGRAF